jgi:hypothetical protein
MVQVDTLSGSEELLPPESLPLAWLLTAVSLSLVDDSLLLGSVFFFLFFSHFFLSAAFFFSRSLCFFLSRSALSFSFLFSRSALLFLAFSFSPLSFLLFREVSASFLLLLLLAVLSSLSGLALLFLELTVLVADFSLSRRLPLLSLAFLRRLRSSRLAAVNTITKQTLFHWTT